MTHEWMDKRIYEITQERMEWPMNVIMDKRKYDTWMNEIIHEWWNNLFARIKLVKQNKLNKLFIFRMRESYQTWFFVLAVCGKLINSDIVFIFYSFVFN